MASGKFSLLTTLTLNATGFNQGVDKAKQKTKDFATGVETAGKSVKQSFAGLTGVAGGLGESLNNSLGGLPSMLSGALGGFKSMIPAITSVKTALISTGIGAIVVALGLAFAALTSYLSGTSEGAMKVKEMFGYISGAATALMNRLKSLGSALFSILTGDIQGFKKSIQDAFASGFIDEVVEKAKEGNELAKERNRLQLVKNQLDSDEVEINAKISELKKQAKDYTKESGYTEKQRNQFQKEAIRLADEFEEKRKKYLYDNWQLEKSINKQSTNLTQAQIDKEIASKKAYYDFITADNQEAIGENKVLAKTQKAMDDEALEAVKQRIALEKQVQTERMRTIGITPESMNTQKKKPINNQKVGLDTKGLERYNDRINDSAEAQTKLFNESKTGWQSIKDSINTTSLGTELASNAVYDLSDAFTGMFEGAEGGFKNVVTSMLGGIQQIINGLLAQAVAAMIAGEASKGIIGLAVGAIGVAALMGLWKSKVPEFANGGIVGGQSFYGDKVSARLNSGEMVLNRSQQANLFAMANGSNGTLNGGEVTFRIEGNALVGVLNNHNKRVNNFR